MRLYYGTDDFLDITIPDGCLVLTNRGDDSAKPQETVAAALNAPLGLPPLEQCITKDDKVVLAIGADVPCESLVVATLIGKLLEMGITAENITVALWESDPNESGQSFDLELDRDQNADEELKRLEEIVPEGVVVMRHKTSDPQSYEILSVLESGDPLAFIRPIVDADVVIPIGVYEPTVDEKATSEHLSVYSALYPRFSGKDAQLPYRSPILFGLLEDEMTDLPDAVMENLRESGPDPLEEYAKLEELSRERWEAISGVPDQRPTSKGEPELTPEQIQEKASPELYRLRRKEAQQQAAWSLGVMLDMIVVPGPGDSIADVWFGLPAEVEKKLEQSRLQVGAAAAPVRGIGKLKFRARPKKVLCSLNGAKKLQTWTRLADLLESAAVQGADRCDIFLCANVTQKIGYGFQLIREADALFAGDLQLVCAKLYREPFPDSIPALRWLRVLQRHKIYWLSNLSDAFVESLGAIPIHNETEMNRALNGAFSD